MSTNDYRSASDHHLNNPAPLAAPWRRSGGLATAARFSPAAPKLAANTSSPLRRNRHAGPLADARAGARTFLSAWGTVGGAERTGMSALQAADSPDATAKPVGNRRAGRLAALALLALTHAASAATVLWTGAGDGVAWNQAANWSNNVLPTASSDVDIPSGAASLRRLPAAGGK